MQLIGPITQIVTLRGLSLRGSVSDDQLEIIYNGGVCVSDKNIVDVGPYSNLRKKYPNARITEIHSPSVMLPAFVDAHTHICWAGTRAADFAMRNAGKSYLEIAESGGGIWSTVTQTRLADQSELENGIINRSKKLIEQGITTVEIKSGYGLDIQTELKMLQAIKNTAERSDIRFISTCLAAHIKPHDFTGDQTAYLRWLLRELLPVVKAETLSRRVDIFTERSAFDIENSWMYLDAARSMGFDITIHADQFSPGGSILACKLKAVSADHLEASGEAEIKALAQSDTVAIALPGASLGLGEPFAPVRKLLDKGAIVAIASDWNPGSAPMGNLIAQASILASYEKITSAEIYASLTYRAAHALRINGIGVIDFGCSADFQLYQTDDHREILYHQGQMLPSQVYSKGISLI